MRRAESVIIKTGFGTVLVTFLHHSPIGGALLMERDTPTPRYPTEQDVMNTYECVRRAGRPRRPDVRRYRFVPLLIPLQDKHNTLFVDLAPLLPHIHLPCCIHVDV